MKKILWKLIDAMQSGTHYRHSRVIARLIHYSVNM